MPTTSKRKEYIRPMNADWWKKNSFYKHYMLREATAIFSLWFSIVLLYGTICLVREGFDFLQGYNSFVHFLQNPLVVIINIVALGAAMLNTVTYFNMTPKVTNIIVDSQKLNPKIITGIMWAITAIVTFLVLFFLVI